MHLRSWPSRAVILAFFVASACGDDGASDATDAAFDGGSDVGADDDAALTDGPLDGGAELDFGGDLIDPVSACVSGPRSQADWGPAPGDPSAEIACVEVSNDTAVDRPGEVAWSSVPVARELDLRDTGGLALIGPGQRRLPAQFWPVSRWGGPLDDETRPIRWLGVAVQANVDAESTSIYALRRYASLDPPDDDVLTQQTGDGLVIDTGPARFTLNPDNPALFESITLDLGGGQEPMPVWLDGAGGGPRVRLRNDGDQLVTLDTTTAGQVVVDAGSFTVEASGPLQAVVTVSGHFVGGPNLARCASGGGYDSLEYSLTARFTRGSADVDLELFVRNACGDATSGTWTDQTIAVEEASFVVPVALAEPVPYAAGSGAIAAHSEAASVRVEQARGGGEPWQRRARLRVDDSDLETAQTFDSPLLALAGQGVVVAVQMPWMRYREPQALSAEDGRLVVEVVSQPLIIGEAKGLWNLARLSIRPAGGEVLTTLNDLREQGQASLERGLLVRAPVEQINASGVFPSLGQGNSPAAGYYREVLDALHEQTVGAGGQWDRAHTYGSQLWPDVQFDPWVIDDITSPEQCDGAMNYWNPSGAELFEYLRTGEAQWAWDFALPQSWLQMVTAYYNIGERFHGARNGVAVTSGGSGEGQWHRSAFGSDDYTYNRGQVLAYVVRPSPLIRRRFGQAGQMLIERYNVPRENEADRDVFLNAVDITRQNVQHYEALANCAEFVPGQRGRDCHDRLLEILTELAEDNLRGGLMCQGDVPDPDTCNTPQQFMQSSMMYGFFQRMYRNYGDVAGRLRRMLVDAPAILYETGIERDDDGVTPLAFGQWSAALDCTLVDDAVDECTLAQDGEGNLGVYSPSQPQILALMLMAHELDPSLGFCEPSRRLLEDESFYGTLWEWVTNDAGWWKGAAQMMQSVVFAIGILDGCSDPG